MAFIRIQKKKYDKNGNIVGGIASIKKSTYIKGKKYHSKQTTVEPLGKVLYLSNDKKSGIFDSPIRGLVFYDVKNNSFSRVSIDDERINNKEEISTPRSHVTFGDTYLLLEFLKKSNMLSVFRKTFSSNTDYEKVLVHLAHDILRDGSHISCENFITKSFISYLSPDVGISSLKSDSRFFEMMGDDDIKLVFFKEYIKTMRKTYPHFGKATYVDSTPLPNDIVNNPFNALCSHGVTTTSVQMRLVLVLDQETGLPVWFDIIPGNVLDVNTLMTITKDVFVSLDIQIGDYILDAGYVSKEVITEFKIGSEKSFIARMPAKKGYPFKELYQETKELLYKGKYQFKRGEYTYTGIQRQVDVFGIPMYEYVYLDHCNSTKGFNVYLNKHEEEFEEMNDDDKDFRMVKDGFFILISNVDKSPKEILTEYYTRTEIEKTFKTSKEYLKLLPISKWKDDTIRGKILTDIIATTIFLMLKKELKEYNNTSIPDLIGSTQSLMCFKGNNIVIVETPNKKVKDYYQYLDIDIPSQIDVEDYLNDLLLNQ